MLIASALHFLNKWAEIKSRLYLQFSERATAEVTLTKEGRRHCSVSRAQPNHLHARPLSSCEISRLNNASTTPSVIKRRLINDTLRDWIRFMKPLWIKYAIVEHVLALKVNMSREMKNAFFSKSQSRESEKEDLYRTDWNDPHPLGHSPTSQ